MKRHTVFGDIFVCGAMASAPNAIFQMLQLCMNLHLLTEPCGRVDTGDKRGSESGTFGGQVGETAPVLGTG